MDSFEFNPTLFDTMENGPVLKKPRQTITSPRSPRIHSNLHTEANDLFLFLLGHNVTDNKYELIGNIITYLQAHLLLPKGDFYSQSTEVGRWLQFTQFLFTRYTRYVKHYSKRQLRQKMIEAILEEMKRIQIERRR